MTNQMLLAQMLTEGAEATQSSSTLPWGTWIPSVIGLLGSLIVAWWSGRKIDKQMELSKQATPPELTRYKTWLEVSEVFKKLEGVKDTGTLADSKEYQEIEASRKVALERAVWERKVISVCPDIHVQRRILNIPYVILLGKKIDFFTLWPWLKSRLVKILEHIFSVFITVWLAVILIECLQGVKNKQDFFVNVLSFVFITYILSYILTLLSADYGEMDTEYYCIQIRTAETESHGEELTGSFSRYVANRRRVRFASLKSEYREWIYYPGFSLRERPIWRFIIPVILFVYNLFPVYWVLCLFSWSKYGEWKMYGTYRLSAFGLDEEKKPKRELWTKLSKLLKEKIRRFK